MKNRLIIFIIVLFSVNAFGQDSAVAPKKVTVNGYIKNLQSLTFDKDFKNIISGNLLHNRINVKWKPSEKITAVAEFRNRLFWGEDVKATPGFSTLLKNENEIVNLQKVWVNNKSLVLHSNTERCFIDFHNNKTKIRIGRQRINWGITTTWNPNDIFNTYNFLDFDYEERPGVDGGKFEYSINDNSNMEIAFSGTTELKKSIAAVKYDINKWGYDLQWITGWHQQRLTIGTGWAGSIKDAGFKGEIQYFFKRKDSADHLNISLEGDYMFKNGWYTNVGLLFNSRGLFKPVNNWNLINLKLSPVNLMPTRFTVMVTTVKEITPLFSVNISSLFSPGTNLLIFLPSFQYNIATNVDVNLIWQSFFAELDPNFQAVSHRGFLRVKWNF